MRKLTNYIIVCMRIITNNMNKFISEKFQSSKEIHEEIKSIKRAAKKILKSKKKCKEFINKIHKTF